MRESRKHNTECTNQTLEDRSCLTPLLQNSKTNKMKHYIVEGYVHVWYTFLKAKEWETQNIGQQIQGTERKRGEAWDREEHISGTF